MAKLVDDLSAFLIQSGKREWLPGQTDCCLFLADWAVWLGHADPARHLRDAYHSEDGFNAIIAGCGGVLPLVSACVASISGRATTTPAAGTIGVIGSSSNIFRQWGSIFDGRAWLVRSRAGIVPISAKPLSMWEI